MINYIQRGDIIDFITPANIASSEAVMMGNLFGVAQRAALAGETVAIAIEGCFLLPKDVSTLTMGQGVYWDDTAKKVTTTVGTNKKIGFAIEAAATGVTTAKIKLQSIF